MVNGPRKFNPELLQALWLIGGIEPEELVAQSIVALQEGFSGSALQQLAGLVSPTRRDLGRLPERAFAEMGLRETGRSQAARFAVENYIPSSSPLMSELVKAFPAFTGRWDKHVAEWEGEPAGAYIDMGEFVEFVVKDLYEKGLVSEVQRAFDFMEESLSHGDRETKDLVSLGFFETLQWVALIVLMATVYSSHS